MIFGHESKQLEFKEAVRLGTLGHAYLFFGDSGIGKRTFAESLACFLESGIFSVSSAPLIDARVFSPAEHGTFSIDQARQVKKFLYQRPFLSPRRTAIIDNAESLTEEAQAALLKIVEEPPSAGLIIFIAVYEDVFLKPLLSRLSRIYFSRLSPLDVEKVLLSLYPDEQSRIKKIAKDSFGSIQTGLRMLLSEKEASSLKHNDYKQILEDTVLSFYRKGVYAHHKLLLDLLRKKMMWDRFNLNETLQKKSLSYIIQKYYE